jgi:hypothetical protein
MSAGSNASNLGYGNIAPFSNVNGRFVNIDNSHSPAMFSSNEIPGLPGLAGAKNNVDAAAGYVPGICLKGGAKKLKRKIKNITKKYKMNKGKNLKNIKKSLKKKYGSKVNFSNKKNVSSAANINRMLAIARIGGGSRKTRRMKNRRMRKTRHQRGGYTPPGLPGIPYPQGYGQYQNNLPMTPTYSVGGQLSSSNLALANPPPIKVLSNCANCVDNYNHNTNEGFPSRGN